MYPSPLGGPQATLVEASGCCCCYRRLGLSSARNSTADDDNNTGKFERTPTPKLAPETTLDHLLRPWDESQQFK